MNDVHPPNKRAVARQRRHDEILAAALQIVVDEGVDALTVHLLARRMKCAVGAMYRYFAGKDALILALQEQAVGRFAEHLDAELSGEGLERVLSAFFAWHSFAEVEPALYSLLDAALSSRKRLLDDEGARAVDERLRAVLDVCAGSLEGAANAGLLAPGNAQLRTYALWAAMHGAEHFQKRDDYAGVASADVREELLLTLLRGWGASL